MPLNLKEAMMMGSKHDRNPDMMDPAEGVNTIGLPLY